MLIKAIVEVDTVLKIELLDDIRCKTPSQTIVECYSVNGSRPYENKPIPPAIIAQISDILRRHRLGLD